MLNAVLIGADGPVWGNTARRLPEPGVFLTGEKIPTGRKMPVRVKLRLPGKQILPSQKLKFGESSSCYR
jgi:hypothetical protein